MDHALWRSLPGLPRTRVSEHQLSTWIRPLQAQEEDGFLRLLATIVLCGTGSKNTIWPRSKPH